MCRQWRANRKCPTTYLLARLALPITCWESVGHTCMKGVGVGGRRFCKCVSVRACHAAAVDVTRRALCDEMYLAVTWAANSKLT